jgi:hypothetical protein
MEGLPAGNGILEPALNHPPLLQVAGLEVKAHLGHLAGWFCRWSPSSEAEARDQDAHHNDRRPERRRAFKPVAAPASIMSQQHKTPIPFELAESKPQGKAGNFRFDSAPVSSIIAPISDIYEAYHLRSCS